MGRIKNFIFDKRTRIRVLNRNGLYSKLGDQEYLSKMFYAYLGHELNLKNPKTFNEKIQWLKLYNRKPEYTMIVDKYMVRDYIAEKLGDEYLIPFLGVWDDPDEIDFGALPNQFVLKCNHNSGTGMCICKDKSKLDIQSVKKNLWKGLKEDYFLTSREWPYKDVPRKIIAENYMVDESGVELKDYKILCFNGKPDNIMVCTGRSSGNVRYYFFDRNWNFLKYQHVDVDIPDDFKLPKPEHLDEMFKIADVLCKGFPLVRVDLYQADNRVYFGELTFYPDSGFDTDILPSTDKLFGEKLVLPEVIR